MTPRFSILIPTWNNLPYLKLCVESLRKHSDAGISAKQFMQGYLHIGEAFQPRLPEVTTSRWKRFVSKIKLINTIIAGK